MTDPDEMREAIAAVAAAFEALNVRWAIGGSLASAAYGEPRSTNDADLVAALTEPDARALVARLGDTFYGDADTAAEAVRRRSSFNVIDRRSFIKVDVFVPAPGPLGTGQLDRRVHLEIFAGMAPVPILTAEDIVLQKLRWFQLGGELSDRQWRDVLSVLRGSRADLDDGYLTSVAAGAGLAEILERARRDVSKP